MEKIKSLKEELSNFKGRFDGGKLEDQFKNIAEAVFRGRFCIKGKDNEGKDIYRYVYPLSIEFYYHEEEPYEGEKENDWIMYHRETEKNVLPAYPKGSLNAHISGIDITFEDNKDMKSPRFRAAILIRKFRVDYYPESSSQTFSLNIEDKGDNRSTKIYDALLMGFSFLDGGISISWEDKETPSKIELVRGYRKNVAEMNEKREKTETSKRESDKEHVNINGKTYLRDQRKWQYAISENDLVK